MQKTLTRITIGQVALLVAILAGYLIAIAATLRKVSETLARVTFGVRAIERQTEPIGGALRGVNADLEAVVAVLEQSRTDQPPS